MSSIEVHHPSAASSSASSSSSSSLPWNPNASPDFILDDDGRVVDKSLNEAALFWPFSHRSDDSYRGTVAFHISGYPNHQKLIHCVHVSDEGVRVFDYEPADIGISCRVTLDRQTFFDVYMGRIHPKNAVLSGKISVQNWAYRELTNWASSFDMSSQSWIDFYSWKAAVDAGTASSIYDANQRPAPTVKIDLDVRPFDVLPIIINRSIEFRDQLIDEMEELLSSNRAAFIAGAFPVSLFAFKFISSKNVFRPALLSAMTVRNRSFLRSKSYAFLPLALSYYHQYYRHYSTIHTPKPSPSSSNLSLSGNTAIHSSARRRTESLLSENHPLRDYLKAEEQRETSKNNNNSYFLRPVDDLTSMLYSTWQLFSSSSLQNSPSDQQRQQLVLQRDAFQYARSASVVHSILSPLLVSEVESSNPPQEQERASILKPLELLPNLSALVNRVHNEYRDKTASVQPLFVAPPRTKGRIRLGVDRLHDSSPSSISMDDHLRHQFSIAASEMFGDTRRLKQSWDDTRREAWMICQLPSSYKNHQRYKRRQMQSNSSVHQFINHINPKPSVDHSNAKDPLDTTFSFTF